MPERLPAPPDAARPRFRGVVTTLLVVMIGVMIARDILARRWGARRPTGRRRHPAFPVT